MRANLSKKADIAMDRKKLLLVLAAYVMWGVLPLYWGLLSGLNSVFILANRIVFAAMFTLLLLAASGRLAVLRELFKDRSKMKFIVPAALIVTVNWGLFIWSVSVGRVMDASLGYYMNPLAVCVWGFAVFREKVSRLEIAALILAAFGVALTTIQFGKFPFVALALALTFSTYGALKKFAHADGLASVCAETLIVTPFALLFIALAPQSAEAISRLAPLTGLLCVGAGIVTALPLVLYSAGVNDLPFATIGFLQYVAPTLMLVIGVLQGEPFTITQGVSFGFIWAGLVLFTVGIVKRSRRAAEADAGRCPNTGKA